MVRCSASLSCAGGVSVFTVGLVAAFHLTSLITSTTATKMHYIHWNTSNPIFRIDNTDHIIDVNKNNFPFDYDQVNIICPTYDKSTDDRDTEKYIIYNVSKEEYDTCRITTLHPRVITVCNKPYDLMYVTITFRPFSPQPNGLEFRPGVDYYFISTSSSDDLERRIGGRCSSHHMKVVFKVCCDPNTQTKPLGDQGGVQLPSNGQNNRGLIAGSNDTHKAPTTTSPSPSKSGRVTPTTTLIPPSTTSSPTSPRRRRPYHNSGERGGMTGGSPYGDDNSPYVNSPYDNARSPYGGSGSSYEYSDYAAVHKDYPYYVKTTTAKYDPMKYPDIRQNEIVKNEALNSGPSSSRPPALWWVVMVMAAVLVCLGPTRRGPCWVTSDLPWQDRRTNTDEGEASPVRLKTVTSASADVAHMQLQEQAAPALLSRRLASSTLKTLVEKRQLTTSDCLHANMAAPEERQWRGTSLGEHVGPPHRRRHVRTETNTYRCCRATRASVVAGPLSSSGDVAALSPVSH
ncbi:uncharacterized protein LOC108682533 [Hyalella azteca]|uniref:Uncharacterized protein LOC108682533 n=1 Tax=Hyalella azteca TaxID=294128 RepID=A0A979FHL9_HYAAZ|nr:uncharacterized protein LOC108682533 [Hyalella azteca]